MFTVKEILEKIHCKEILEKIHSAVDIFFVIYTITEQVKVLSLVTPTRIHARRT